MSQTGFEPHPSPTISLSGTSHSRSPFSPPTPNLRPRKTQPDSLTIGVQVRESPTNISVISVATYAILVATQVHSLPTFTLRCPQARCPPLTFVRGHRGGSFEGVGGSVASPVWMWSAWVWGSGGTKRMARSATKEDICWPVPGRWEYMALAMCQELEDTLCIIAHESRLASMTNYTILAATPETLNLSKLTASRWPSQIFNWSMTSNKTNWSTVS